MFNQKIMFWITKTYLIAYNFISFFSWLFILYDSSEISKVQSLAMLEIFHSGLGLVKSPILTTIIQISSRMLIVTMLEEIHLKSHFYTLMVVSWGLTEIVR